MELVKNPHVRVAIVPVVVIGGEKFLLFGIDTRTGDITDLGGGLKKGETLKDGAMREFTEETLGIFKDLKWPTELSLYYSSGNMIVFFVFVDTSFVHISSKFPTEVIKRSLSNERIEVNSLLWLPFTKFKSMLSCKSSEMRLWSRLHRYYGKLFNCSS
jgi:8-oxo-dGTP pyrophosphatase MutT (NUDIX family)